MRRGSGPMGVPLWFSGSDGGRGPWFGVLVRWFTSSPRVDTAHTLFAGLGEQCVRCDGVGSPCCAVVGARVGPVRGK